MIRLPGELWQPGAGSRCGVSGHVLGLNRSGQTGGLRAGSAPVRGGRARLQLSRVFVPGYSHVRPGYFRGGPAGASRAAGTARPFVCGPCGSCFHRAGAIRVAGSNANQTDLVGWELSINLRCSLAPLAALIS